jgi:hypothetical protein
MTPEQKTYLEKRYKQFYVKGWDELLIKLKAHGGDMILPENEPESHVQWLLKDGRVFDTTKLLLQVGEPDECHTNTGRIWAQNEQLQLVIGYALFKGEELWRKHSWLWNPNTGELVETTRQAEKYYGVVLQDITAFNFVMEHVPEFCSEEVKSRTKLPRRFVKCHQLALQYIVRRGGAERARQIANNEI